MTPFGEDGNFNNYLVKLAATDEAVRNNLISQLLYTVQDRGYAGVDVDFEYILPEDREAYAAFVGELRQSMNENGYSVSVALAPKTSAEQRGLLYSGVDYRLLGENADWVFLMTYEWGYTYSEPMAVAPIDKVRQVLNYAVQELSLIHIFYREIAEDVIRPSAEECTRNPRARSTKMRWAVKV